ncbi:MAG: NAD(P)/FAD-dependent oxidoreductase [Myxococcota bacterium]|nr:NAD(P)/FAD-dependent oxidoreductase [Myxococcota bacterium]
MHTVTSDALGHAMYDAVVVGGGVAGSTSAVSLAKKGLRVLLCEAGLPSNRRLAGELLHPPATRTLDELGLLPELEAAGAMPAYGFAIFTPEREKPTMLSYSEIRGERSTGIALEHASITHALLTGAKRTPGITVWDDARVLAVEQTEGGNDVRIQRKSESEARTISTRFVVSAEGRKSKLRSQADIGIREHTTFRMLGWKIPNARLPYPGYGHVFVGSHSPVLAYQVSRTETRVMFEVPLDAPLEVPRSLLAALPEPFRSDVERGIAEQPRTTARFCGLHPSRVTAEKLAVVGDAGGCVHPLIASGMSFCISDAARLANAFSSPTTSVEEAFAKYETSRRQPMFTRSALGPALVDALCGEGPEFRLVRHGLFRYWDRSMRGRETSLSLLACRESSLPTLIREYVTVCGFAMTGMATGVVKPQELPGAAFRLLKKTSGYIRNAA